MAQGNSRSAASGRNSKDVSRKHPGWQARSGWEPVGATVYPLLGFPRTLFTRKGYAASVSGVAANGCPTLPLREISGFIDSLFLIKRGVRTSGCCRKSHGC